jgi:membrane-associated protein
MIILSQLIDFIIHIDKYLGLILQNYGALSYLILFLIIFIETGVVIMPFLPGDSLLFIAGTFASSGLINIALLFFVLLFAAIIGDSVNYWVGSFLGEKFFEKSRFFRKDYLDRTKLFYKKHGGKTIILARFIPIIRTFAPFVAGVGKMDYPRFLSFNVLGATAWVALFTFAGYFFGTIPFVQDNLNWLVWVIILTSILPVIYEYIEYKIKAHKKR